MSTSTLLTAPCKPVVCCLFPHSSQRSGLIRSSPTLFARALEFTSLPPDHHHPLPSRPNSVRSTKFCALVTLCLTSRTSFHLYGLQAATPAQRPSSSGPSRSPTRGICLVFVHLSLRPLPLLNLPSITALLSPARFPISATHFSLYLRLYLGKWSTQQTPSSVSLPSSTTIPCRCNLNNSPLSSQTL